MPLVIAHAIVAIFAPWVISPLVSLIVAATFGATLWLSPPATAAPATAPGKRQLLLGFAAILAIMAVVVVETQLVEFFVGPLAALIFPLAMTALEVELIKRRIVTPSLLVVAVLLLPVFAAQRVPTTRVANAIDAATRFHPTRMRHNP